MNDTFTYRLMDESDAPLVSDLVTKVFMKSIAPLYSPEGAREFLRYTHPDAMIERTRAGHLTLLAELEGKVIGTIHIRSCNHVSLLFVDEEEQEKGIAGELLRRAIKICKDKSPDILAFTVNSSPNSVKIYQRIGFQDTGPEQVKNGIRFTPMVLDLHGRRLP
ncbi:MAG: GNAT family N-acetyltransferase [Desulfomonilia bacterium]